MEIKGFVSLPIMVLALLLLCGPVCYAEEGVEGAGDASPVESAEPVPDSVAADVSGASDGGSFRWSSLWMWPFNYVVQPLLNALVYPIAKPVDYAFKNGIIEKSVELITFGEKRNILLYPGFNLKPGSQTMLGMNYRHREILLNKDYLVVQGGYYANGDVDLVARYTKNAVFGSPFFWGFRYSLTFDRDNSFTVPETKRKYLQPDSSMSFSWRVGTPLTSSATWNAEVWTTLRLGRFSHPDVDDSVLVSEEFPIEDRGLYQHYMQVPVGLSIDYDNLDFPYAPSRGNRILFSIDYTFVGEYSGIRTSDLGLSSKDVGKERFEDSKKNHDYWETSFTFQHYFYLGKAENYILSAKEARKNRKFYTDFSWDEALRVWRPDQLWETLFERRVIAVQYRLLDMWEIEKGGAPHDAFYSLNTRTPLRGYGSGWTAHHVMSLSAEYRWPVDRFVDGVLFNEYAMIAPEFNKWSLDQFYNSWGFGIRVRMPNMYLFRVQFGFHGLHGVNLIITIAPEFK